MSNNVRILGGGTSFIVDIENRYKYPEDKTQVKMVVPVRFEFPDRSYVTLSAICFLKIAGGQYDLQNVEFAYTHGLEESLLEEVKACLTKDLGSIMNPIDDFKDYGGEQGLLDKLNDVLRDVNSFLGVWTKIKDLEEGYIKRRLEEKAERKVKGVLLIRNRKDFDNFKAIKIHNYTDVDRILSARPPGRLHGSLIRIWEMFESGEVNKTFEFESDEELFELILTE